MSTNRKLGSDQEMAMDSLRRHGGYPGGWYIENNSRTVRILESLVRRGLVVKYQTTRDTGANARTTDHYRLP